MTTPERRLAELGIELPPTPTPAGTYVPAVQVGNLLFLSGLGPRRADGTMVQGKVGADLTIEQGREAARLVALNMLVNIRAALGSLDRVERVVKTLGMVNSAPDFDQHPKVIDGFADLFVEVFGPERGRGARSAVGMAALPNRIAVEVETIVQVRD
jgi:enamine deaminase RidA (YjgF/YER057c/UK114 family)